MNKQISENMSSAQKKRPRRRKYTRTEKTSDIRVIKGKAITLLRLVAEYRYMTSRMLMAITGLSKRGVDRYVRILFDNSLVEQVPAHGYVFGGGSAQAVSFISETGRKLLAQELKKDLQDMPGSPAGQVNSETHIRHSLLVSRTHAAVAIGCHVTEGLELVAWHNESRQKFYQRVTAPDGQQYPVIPDAFFSVADSRNGSRKMVHFFLEADRSTMSHQDMITKYKGYYLLHKIAERAPLQTFNNIQRFRVLTVIEGRENDSPRLARCMQDAREVTANKEGAGFFWFAHADEFAVYKKEKRHGTAAYTKYVPNPLPFLQLPMWSIAKGDSSIRYPIVK